MNPSSNISRICFLIPYFGSWPKWLPFFIESCRKNPDITWKIFSDCGEIPDCPKNVHIHSMLYDAYCEKISRAIGLDFQPAQPIKLCDTRPMIGCIHQDDIAGFDFWAWGDIDLVYGNLRAYFTEERLARKNLFSTYERRVSGPLCIVRNTPEMNELFFKMKNWKERLLRPTLEALDEGAFSRVFIKWKNWPPSLARLVWKCNPLYREAEFVQSYNTPYAKLPWTDGTFNFPTRWFWRNGTITTDINGERMFPYFHFMTWKHLEHWKTMSPEKAESYRQLARQSAWQIDETGFSSIS